MRATITELIHANVLEVFNERDSARRRAIVRDGFIVELYTVLTDHDREPAPHWIDLTETNEEES
jgi:hypothetical protein